MLCVSDTVKLNKERLPVKKAEDILFSRPNKTLFATEQSADAYFIAVFSLENMALKQIVFNAKICCHSCTDPYQNANSERYSCYRLVTHINTHAWE